MTVAPAKLGGDFEEIPAYAAGETENPSDHRWIQSLAYGLAEDQEVFRHPGKPQSFTEVLKQYEALILEVYQHYRGIQEQELAFTNSAEWVLDNHHILHQTLRLVEEELPDSYFHQLPKIAQGQSKDLPRIYILARVLVLHENAQIEVEQVVRFLALYQEKRSLTMGELWAMPIMLRIGILQMMGKALLEITRIPFELDDPTFIGVDLSPETLDVIVANGFISLRALAAEDWKEFFERLSLVEQELRRDPAHVYAHMDFETRDMYRKAIEKLAQRLDIDEKEVAQQAIRLAQNSSQEDPPDQNLQLAELDKDAFARQDEPLYEECPEAHVGFFLFDQGRRQLDHSLNDLPGGGTRLREWIGNRPGLVYLGGIALFSLVMLGVLVAYISRYRPELWQTLAFVFLGIAPVVTLAVSLMNWIVTNTVPPKILPKMDFSEKIPQQFKTMVVIPALLSGTSDVSRLFEQLELHKLRNPAPDLYFGLLTDFSDAPERKMPEDDEILETAICQLKALNQKYGDENHGPFFLFHRQRRWNPAENTWMGWERKRGKLHEFNRLILGDTKTSFVLQQGDLDVLRGIKFVITLDADTILPREGADKLIAALAHPLNRPRFDAKSGRIVSGYTILQPRTEVNPAHINRSLFTRVFAGDRGLDLYTLAVSDVYQDLFGEGIYTGKGIYDVRAFERSLENRVPENALLSHDLFEGVHGRVGLVTDIMLVEDYPPNYLVFTTRLHRWVRGDWQLLPWLLPVVPSASGRWIPNTLSAIDCWKIIDNLRRSLAPINLILLLVAGWIWLPGSPLLWTLVGLLPYLPPVVTSFIEETSKALHKAESSHKFTQTIERALRGFLAIAFLPYEAIQNTEAILVTLTRLLVTHRQMLQWTTAEQSENRLGRVIDQPVAWKRMATASGLGFTIALLLSLFQPRALPAASPLILLWLLSPQIAYWVSIPLHAEQETLDQGKQDTLRRLARRTWLFFEQFLGPEDHWLPPDHFQEYPLGAVAHRTSPTNIGLALLATLAAYDFGYIGVLDLVTRLRSTLDTLDRLERYRGHFLNWYDTRSLESLSPAYVSTVDSGNLAACLIALREGCQTISGDPLLRWNQWQGLLDLLHLFHEIISQVVLELAKQPAQGILDTIDEISTRIEDLRGKPERWITFILSSNSQILLEIDQKLGEFVAKTAEDLGTSNLHMLRICSRRLRYHLENAQRELKILHPWLVTLNDPPVALKRSDLAPELRSAWQALKESNSVNISLAEIASHCSEVEKRLDELERKCRSSSFSQDEADSIEAWCSQFRHDIKQAAITATTLEEGFADIKHDAGRLITEMDFQFLFNPKRQVFHIGYNLSLNRMDSNYYDLLASESRMTSLVSIAKGDIPQRHWLHLGRPLTRVDGTRALLSWSGTMFEYLMPILLLRSYPNTLLRSTIDAVVQRQISYGEEKKVPWGISESGYFRLDASQSYQYRAFGVPGLGFKRGLGDDLVITPYASLLALPLRPQAVVDNLESLENYQMMGSYGLYEAIDFTPARLELGDKYQIVRSFMAHHQGMIFLALANFLNQDVMIQRFNQDPKIQSVELLLQERIPYNAPLEGPQDEAVGPARTTEAEAVIEPWPVRVQAAQPRAHFLSNGRYGLLITSAGSGYSSWKNIDLTRWRADTTLNNWGSWIYIQLLDEQGKNHYLWSASFQPTAVRPRSRDVTFDAHMVEFRRSVHGIYSSLEITVAPEADVEIRRLTLTNHADHPCTLRLTSYAEVILAPQAEDQRHPAYNRLFIDSEYSPDQNALIFRRRPRSGDEEPVYLAHFLVTQPGVQPTGVFENDRLRFLGRGHTWRDPSVLQDPGWLSGESGATLDPIMSIGQELVIEAHHTVQVAFLTACASSRQEIDYLVGNFRSLHQVAQAFSQARSQAGLELRQLGLDTSQLALIEKLFSLLVYPHQVRRAAPAVLAANTKGQPELWPFSISGDYPILLVRIHEQEQLSLLYELLQAHIYWRSRRLKIDLVILNEQATNYGQELNNAINRLLGRMNSEDWINQRGGIFVISGDRLSQGDRNLLETAARAILDGGQGSLPDQLREIGRLPARLPSFEAIETELVGFEPIPPLPRPDELLFDNGLGGFSPDGREYQIYLESGQWTPAPWVNVIANEDFGFLVTETGAGFTWATNSGENRLTPWSNDPVCDLPGEALYLRDDDTAEIWSPTPLPARDQEPYLIRHGAGYSIFEHHSHGLKQRLRLFAAVDAPVKIVQLRIENTWNRQRKLSATFYVEWVLGVSREASQQYIVPEFEEDSQALLARNAYNSEFGEQVAFLAAGDPIRGLTADRTEFLGRMGSPVQPAALGRVGLSGTIQAGVDPCAALQIGVELAPGEAKEIFFLLGQEKNRSQAIQLIQRFRNPGEVEIAWQRVEEFWKDLLGTLKVKTPDPGMDLLLNHWLLYQTLSCRIWGRSAFYQSSGAFGFRDQLQDVMSLVHAAPQLARQHILRTASRQFKEGDVLHWWHPPSGRGVRTRISDDMLWLPYVTAFYVKSTGDEEILDEKVPFLTGPALQPHEQEHYDFYGSTAEAEKDTSASGLYSLYEHCQRAILKGSTKGEHNLPLMGSGDWNDGMNRVGIGGRGESVWLGWFLCATLNDFAELCERKGDSDLAADYRAQASGVQQALEQYAWDGGWYLRAFYDDGSPLGSAANKECTIDAIAQSWAALSKSGSKERVSRALQAVSERLIREDDQLLLLFTPPFDKSQRDPGYIKGYLPGIRENGGQYTHAALWTIWALAESGHGDYAAELFRMINPVYHSDTPQKAARYRIEPYVIAADVYSAEPHVGRGGWSWYTGSAGWMYRLGLEAILGLHKEGSWLEIDPHIPQRWESYEITYREGDIVLDIEVQNPDRVSQGVRRMILDGEPLPKARIPLKEDGKRHRVVVELGKLE